MWKKFLDQIPALIITAVLVIGSTVWMFNRVVERQQAELKPLREQNDALKQQAEDSRRQIEATTMLIKQAVNNSDGALFRTENEIQKLNDDRIDHLANAIAGKVVLPGPKTVAEAEQMQAAQVEQIATRLTSNLTPLLTGMSSGEKEKAAFAEKTRQNEARIQQLTTNLQETQLAAQDAVQLTQEVSTLYLDSFKDHGVLVRILSLPANVVQDAVGLNFITGRDRAKATEEVNAKVNEIQKRMAEIQSAAAKS